MDDDLRSQFKLLDPPADGLTVVMRNARLRSVRRQIRAGALALTSAVVLILAFAGFGSITQFTQADGAHVAAQTTGGCAMDAPAALVERGMLNAICLDGNSTGLPGVSVSHGMRTSPVPYFLLAAGILIILVCCERMVRSSLRRSVPIKSTPLTGIFILAVGAAITAMGGALLVL